MAIDDKGRCCGRKPIHYKGGAWNSPHRPMLFCCRCDREYDPVTLEQQENWAWRRGSNGVWVCTTKKAMRTPARATGGETNDGTS